MAVRQDVGKPLVWLHGEVRTPPLTAAARVEAGDTEWTITRPGGLTNKPKGGYIVCPGNSLRGHGSTPRADLAEALVLAVTEERWLRQAVVVAA